jgi:hypothetical protein
MGVVKMKKILIMFLILVISIIGFAGYESDMTARMKPIEEKTQQQLDTGVNMLGATKNLEQAWDTELNKIYKLLMSKLSGQQQTKLRNEQLAWIKERDKKAKQEAEAEDLGGQMYEMFVSDTKTGLVKTRALELARRYDKLNKK